MDKLLEANVSRMLDDISRFGEDQGGGVTRLLYSPAWKRAQRFVASMMDRAGLEVSFDEIGNVYGKLVGTDLAAPSIVTGSHIDTVRNGGKYDGALGIAAGIAALSSLKKRFGSPRRTLEVVSFCEEEGSRFPLAYWGSGNVTGRKPFDRALEARDEEGMTLSQAMTEAGFNPLSHKKSRRSDIGTFIELHIEQGEKLHRNGCAIGIVDAIVGQRRYTVELIGRARHAGTTPMEWRRDALAAAAEMIRRLRLEAGNAGDGLVATVGKLELSPNVSNVIPGAARFTVDVRHRDEAVLHTFCERFSRAFEELANECGVSISMECWLSELPAPMDEGLNRRILDICRSRGLASLRLSSGAGHDAGLFVNVCPTAMIFIPSRDGISHSPDEYTSPEEVETGTAVLTDLLCRLGCEEDIT